MAQEIMNDLQVRPSMALNGTADSTLITHSLTPTLTHFLTSNFTISPSQTTNTYSLTDLLEDDEDAAALGFVNEWLGAIADSGTSQKV